MKHASLITNLSTAAMAAIGFSMPQLPAAYLLQQVGLFGFSGGITNWLAVHMLFEKVPGLYGSGVIPNRFEEFKSTIKQLMLKEFFDKQHIERFFLQQTMADTSAPQADQTMATQIAAKVDYDTLFDKLVQAIVESPLGGMLSFVGGAQALQPMREPVKLKLQEMIAELAEKHLSPNSDESSGSSFIDSLRDKVEAMIDSRLAELSPSQVKTMVQQIIAEHLGWLVIWGGVFGSLMGLVAALVG